MLGSKEKIAKEAIGINGTKLFKAGSLLVGMYDTAAFKLGILLEESSSNQACANIQPNNDLCNIEWLFNCFQIMRPLFLQSRKGIRQQNLSQSVIKKIKIPLPNIAEQNTFALHIKKQVDTIMKQKECYQESENLFNSLLQKAFRGEL